MVLHLKVLPAHDTIRGYYFWHRAFIDWKEIDSRNCSSDDRFVRKLQRIIIEDKTLASYRLARFNEGKSNLITFRFLGFHVSI